MRVLVTGGAGYIGSHAARCLRDAGHVVTVLDNLSRGHAAALLPGAVFAKVDLRESDAVAQVLEQNHIECVMHFAALAYVGESVELPLLYYDNNTSGTCSLLLAMKRVNVQRLVFSSTCATYGEPSMVPIREVEPQRPINPYGRSKLFIEGMLADLARSWPEFGYAALRYFNVAGCASDGSLGEDHRPETHLIPLVLLAALGRIPQVKVFGDDYPTTDGTCIRDYIHVEDLARAHVAVMESLVDGDARHYNLGIGRGYSVREVIESVRRVTGRPIAIEMVARRPGDPAQLYACPERIMAESTWRPRFTSLDAIVETAFCWFREHPTGYGS